MKAMYEARVRDIGPADQVKVICGRCLHEVFIPQSGLLHGLRLPPETMIDSLEPRFRCQECDAKGMAIVSVVWDGAPVNPMYRSTSGG